MGDYGHWNGTTFQREGNIFEDVKSLSLQTDFNLIDPKVLHFVEHKISSARGTSTEGESVATLWSCLPGVVLQQPIGLSLANNQDVLCTLKVLFSVSDITNRYLVTQIIQCSACYPTNNFVRSIQAQTMQDGISEDGLFYTSWTRILMLTSSIRVIKLPLLSNTIAQLHSFVHYCTAYGLVSRVA